MCYNIHRLFPDTSFGDYAVPMHIGAENSLLPPSRRYSDSDTSGDQNSDYMFLQVSVSVPAVPVSRVPHCLGLLVPVCHSCYNLEACNPPSERKVPTLNTKLSL